MLDSKEVSIEGEKFILHPLKGFTGLHLDKKVTSLLMPLLSGFKGLDEEFEIGDAMATVSEALGKMSEVEYEAFILKLLSTVHYCPAGQPIVEFDASTIESFAGKNLVIYELMFKVMQYNNFAPFALVAKAGGLGKGIQNILSSSKATTNQKL